MSRRGPRERQPGGDGWPLASSVTSVLPSLVVVLALVALTLYGLARRRTLAFLGVWFFAILAPTSSFYPIITELAAERRMYLPLMAAVLLVVLAGHALLRRLRAPRAAGLAVVAALAGMLIFMTVRRNEDYATTLSFWNDVVAKRPDNPRARMWLAAYLHDQGRNADALVHLEQAVRIRPEDSNAHYNLGIVLGSLNRTDEAIAHYRGAIGLDHTSASAHYGLGIALGGRGEIDAAIDSLEAALRLQPDFPKARGALEHLKSRAR